MLRGALGDSLFFESLSRYANNDKFRYKHATTEDFKKTCEDVSGINLTKFFEQWVYGEYYPHYSYGYSIDSLENNFKINLEIDQVQVNTGLFWMPIDIRVTTSSGEQIFVVWDSLQTQIFELLISEKPLLVELDPNNWILKEVSEKIVNPPLDKGVLLVNGLDWRMGDEVFEAYGNKAFWGDTKISFWDLFNEPSKGYPTSLPTAIGNGTLSNFTISNYSTIIWLSELRNGDLNAWQKLELLDYLNAGGNIIMITKRGQDLISDALKNYLGINWDVAGYSTIKDMKSVSSNFTDISLIGDNSVSALFDTTLTQDYSELIYVSTESFDSPKGSGVWSKPDGKGEFVYIAGRPYKFNHNDLSSNLQKILVDGMGEIVGIDDKTTKNIPSKFELTQNYPNPFNPSTTIKYSIPEQSNVKIEVFNMLGQSVEVLVNSEKLSGLYETTWNAENLPSGIYLISIKAEGLSSKKNFVQVKKALLLK